MNIDNINKYLGLSEKARYICKKNYDKNCGTCPLRLKCCHINHRSLNELTKAINDEAEKIFRFRLIG